MTRDEAVKIYRAAGMSRLESLLRERWPQAHCDRALMDSAEDGIDALIALGILRVDGESPQETTND